MALVDHEAKVIGSRRWKDILIGNDAVRQQLFLSLSSSSSDDDTVESADLVTIMETDRKHMSPIDASSTNNLTGHFFEDDIDDDNSNEIATSDYDKHDSYDFYQYEKKIQGCSDCDDDQDESSTGWTSCTSGRDSSFHSCSSISLGNSTRSDNNRKSKLINQKYRQHYNSNRRISDLEAVMEVDRSEHEPSKLNLLSTDAGVESSNARMVSTRCVVIEECNNDDDFLIGREKLLQLFAMHNSTTVSQQLDDKTRMKASNLRISETCDEFYKRDFLGILFNTRKSRATIKDNDKTCFEYVYHVAIASLCTVTVIWIVVMIYIFGRTNLRDKQTTSPIDTDTQSFSTSTNYSNNNKDLHNQSKGFIYNTTLFQPSQRMNLKNESCQNNAIVESLSSQPILSMDQKNPILGAGGCSIISKNSTFSGKKGLVLDMDAANLRNANGTGILSRQLIFNLTRPYWTYESYPRLSAAGHSNTTELIPMIVSDNVTYIDYVIGRYMNQSMTNSSTQRLMGYVQNDVYSTENTFNMTINQTLDVWSNLESWNVSLISPSRINPTGRWMKKFMSRVALECKRVDYIGVQWTSSILQSNLFKKYMDDIHELYQRPLLITKINPLIAKSPNQYKDTNTYMIELLQFMKEVIPWLERQDWIVGYAWVAYPSMSMMKNQSGISTFEKLRLSVSLPSSDTILQDGSLFFNDGDQLTPIGEYFASVSNENPYGNLKIKIESASSK
jgi:Glycosyl hydrolase catalytic core